MSYQTMNYLNSGKILVGNVKKTGRHAWWYDQTKENPLLPSHFDGPIPLIVVKDRLLGWDTLESVSLMATFQVYERDEHGNIKLDDEGNAKYKEISVPCPSFKALGREDWIRDGVPEDEESGADAVLYIQGKDYGTRQLKQLFLQTTAELVGGADELVIESAGLLKWGRRGWITIALPENLHNDASGLDFRPQLTVSTSFDSSLPTSFTRTYGIPVCDNTLDWEIMKAGDVGRVVFKNTKNSDEKIAKVKEVLGLLTQQAEVGDMAFTEMSKVDVSDELFGKWLDKMVPIPEPTVTKKMVSIQGEMTEAESYSTKGQTMALNKRDKVIEMWNHDQRVTPWRGTKLGVLQLWNTFQTHESRMSVSSKFDGNRLQARVENNMMRVIANNKNNSFKAEDTRALELLDEVLAAESPVLVSVPAGAPTSDPEKMVTRGRKPTNPSDTLI